MALGSIRRPHLNHTLDRKVDIFMNLLHPRVNAAQLESFRLRNGFWVGNIWALLTGARRRDTASERIE